jgi:hypothetical protein
MHRCLKETQPTIIQGKFIRKPTWCEKPTEKKTNDTCSSFFKAMIKNRGILQAQIMIQLEVHKANQCLQIPNIFINPQRGS